MFKIHVKTDRRFFSKKSSIKDILKFISVILAFIWLLAEGTDSLGYNWQWYRVPKYIFTFENGSFIAGPLIRGLIVTFQIIGISLVLSLLFGLTAALLRISDSFMGRFVARTYLELIRNTPLLVQLFFMYFVFGTVVGIDKFSSAVLALSLFEGAYVSEIIRAGIVSIQKGQWEAAYCLGLRQADTYRYIILPQTLRRILPPLTSQAISLIKDSSLVSIIAVYDLTMQGQIIIAETFLTFELWFTIAAVYLVITVSLSVLVNFLENHLKVKA